MTTLKQLYQQFGHDPKWQRFAVASTQPMVSVFLRKFGDTDVSSLSDFDLALQLAMSEQPEERKVKAKSCMQHMLRWAQERGMTDIPSMDDPKPEPLKPEPKPKKEAEEVTKSPKPVSKSQIKPKKAQKIANSEPKIANKAPKPKKYCKSAPKPKKEPKIVTPEKPKAEPVTAKRPTRGQHQAKPVTSDADTLDSEAWLADTRPRRGTIYHDTSSKGWKGGHRVFKDCWRADIMIQGVRYRHRAETREDCEQWLKAVISKKILPTDNKADWWRMEQRKDEAVRIDEIIVNQAEEAVMLYDYHQTGDLTAISEYITKRLLPHMVYYCAHTLRLGQVRTQTASKQAIALLLTRITQGRPVPNFTNSCKRMLRTYRERGDFFYYETHAPRDVKHIVHGIDFAPLTELYKITKDKRI